MSGRILHALHCDFPGCIAQWTGPTVEAARAMTDANHWQRVYDTSSGLLLFLDFCPEHYVSPTSHCRRGHAIVFQPTPWATNQRPPARCPACGEDLTP
jgi:hypothetical protein